MKLDKLYVIDFPRFESLVCVNLSPEQIKMIKALRRTMSSDEYAGYSPTEQRKRQDIVNLVESQIIPVERIPM